MRWSKRSAVPPNGRLESKCLVPRCDRSSCQGKRGQEEDRRGSSEPPQHPPAAMQRSSGRSTELQTRSRSIAPLYGWAGSLGGAFPPSATALVPVSIGPTDLESSGTPSTNTVKASPSCVHAMWLHIGRARGRERAGAIAGLEADPSAADARNTQQQSRESLVPHSPILALGRTAASYQSAPFFPLLPPFTTTS